MARVKGWTIDLKILLWRKNEPQINQSINMRLWEPPRPLLPSGWMTFQRSHRTQKLFYYGMIYYTESTEIIFISTRKKHREKLGSSFWVSSPIGITLMCLILPAMMYDNLCKMLSTREAHLHFGVQGFYHPLPNSNPIPARPMNKNRHSL
jgi:hypothetical protein